MTAALVEIVAVEARRDTFGAARAFGAHLQAHYGTAAAAVIFYGSCLRQNTDAGLMLDFYVLVDNTGRAFGNAVSAAFARLLPPNVYYHEVEYEGRKLRAKVAVISVDQFLQGLGPGTFSSSLWARFAQPAVILQARNDELRRRLVDGLAAAVTTMIMRTQPLMAGAFTPRELWVRAFSETYAAELRPERDAKSGELVDAELPRYVAVTVAVLGAPGPGGAYHRVAAALEQNRARRAWRWRRIQGKILNVLRLIKAAFTFKGGLDYAAWKIERHSGVKIELTDRDRKHPLLTGARLLVTTFRRGGLR